MLSYLSTNPITITNPHFVTFSSFCNIYKAIFVHVERSIFFNWQKCILHCDPCTLKNGTQCKQPLKLKRVAKTACNNLKCVAGIQYTCKLLFLFDPVHQSKMLPWQKWLSQYNVQETVSKIMWVDLSSAILSLENTDTPFSWFACGASVPKRLGFLQICINVTIFKNCSNIKFNQNQHFFLLF